MSLEFRVWKLDDDGQCEPGDSHQIGLRSWPKSRPRAAFDAVYLADLFPIKGKFSQLHDFYRVFRLQLSEKGSKILFEVGNAEFSNLK